MMDVDTTLGLGLDRLQMKFLSMKTNEILTDATVVCHGIVIKAHKCVLAVNSSYFKTVFSKYVTDNVQVDCSEQTSNVDQFGSIIDFMYTGNISVNEENIADLVGLGVFFGIDDLVYICVKYIGQSLNRDNCLQIYLNLHNAPLNCEGPITLSSLSSEVNLGSKVWKMVEASFHDYIVHQEYILQVSTDDMEHLLQKDITKQCSVEGVLGLADRWLQAHPDTGGVQIIQKLLPMAVDRAENLMFAGKDSVEIVTCRDNMAAVLSQISTDTQFTAETLDHIYTVLDLRDKNILIGDSVYTSFLTGNEAFDDVQETIDTNISVYSLSEFTDLTTQPGIDAAVTSEVTADTTNEMEPADVTMVNEENTSTMFYQCSVCFRLFQQKLDLETHMGEHGSEAGTQCRKCYQVFDSALKLETHVCNDWSLQVVQINTQPGADSQPSVDTQTNTDTQLITEVTYSQPSANIQSGIEDHVSVIDEPPVLVSSVKKRMSPDRPFVCAVCGKSFKRKDHLGIHARGHTGELPYPCPACPSRFRMRKNLNVHMLKHTYEVGDGLGCEICHEACGGGQHGEIGLHMRRHMAPIHRVRCWRCTECAATFPKKILLKAHMAKHSAARPVCVWCKKQFTTRTELVMHRKVCTSERVFACPHCDKKFQVRAILKKHIIQVHDTDRKFTCDVCDKSFVDKYNLQRHRTIHTEELPFTCPSCDKSFKHKSGLIRHSRIDHNEGNRFTCNKCHMVFSDSYDLKRHNKLHTGDTPFKCNICEDAQFTKSSGLKHHFRRIHNITDIEAGMADQGSFKCERCSEEFPTKSLQIKHIKDAHGRKLHRKRSHPCGLCSEVFPEQTDLILHVQMHVFESPYNCDICGKPFEEEFKMRRHLDSHSSRTVSCEFCKAVYTTKSGHDAHIRKVHPEAARPMRDLVHRCAECGDKFPDNKDLLAHIQTHFDVTKQSTEAEILNAADVEQQQLLKEIVVDVDKKFDVEQYDKIIYIEMSENAANNSDKNAKVLVKKVQKVSKRLDKRSKTQSDEHMSENQNVKQSKKIRRKPKTIFEKVPKPSHEAAVFMGNNILEKACRNITKQASSGRLLKKPGKLSKIHKKQEKLCKKLPNNISGQPRKCKTEGMSKNVGKGISVSVGPVEVKTEPVDSCDNRWTEPTDSPAIRSSSRKRLKKVIVDV